MNHPPAVCVRMMGLELQYSFKTWSDRFKCPVCGASQRRSLNFLGSRKLVCDGERIVVKSTKEART